MVIYNKLGGAYMITYIVTYKHNSGLESLAKLEANNFREANQRAEEVIAFINEKLSVKHELVSIVPLHSLEDWTND